MKDDIDNVMQGDVENFQHAFTNVGNNNNNNNNKRVKNNDIILSLGNSNDNKNICQHKLINDFPAT